MLVSGLIYKQITAHQVKSDKIRLLTRFDIKRTTHTMLFSKQYLYHSAFI